MRWHSARSALLQPDLDPAFLFLHSAALAIPITLDPAEMLNA